SQIWSNSPQIAPLRESYVSGRPIEWARVHDLPDFVYFNHSIHIKKGVGCVSCHGRVDKMPLTYREHTLTMAWCLDCHRHPEKNLRPRSAIYKMDWKPQDDGYPDQIAMGTALLKTYNVLPAKQLTNCSICHR